MMKRPVPLTPRPPSDRSAMNPSVWPPLAPLPPTPDRRRHAPTLLRTVCAWMLCIRTERRTRAAGTRGAARPVQRPGSAPATPQRQGGGEGVEGGPAQPGHCQGWGACTLAEAPVRVPEQHRALRRPEPHPPAAAPPLQALHTRTCARTRTRTHWNPILGNACCFRTAAPGLAALASRRLDRRCRQAYFSCRGSAPPNPRYFGSVCLAMG